MKDNKMYWPYDVVFRITKADTNPMEWAVLKVYPSGKTEEVCRCQSAADALVMFDRLKEEYRKEMEAENG
jgi:hypothetical protein